MLRVALLTALASASCQAEQGRRLLAVTAPHPTGGAPGKGGAAVADSNTTAVEVPEKKAEKEWHWIDAKELSQNTRSSITAASRIIINPLDNVNRGVQVYILTASWELSRAGHAQSICDNMSTSECHVVEGIKSSELETAEAQQAYVTAGEVNLDDLPGAPRWRLKLPGLLRVLQREYPKNQLQYPARLANTLGNIMILKKMHARIAADHGWLASPPPAAPHKSGRASAAHPPPAPAPGTVAASENTLYVYLEDDADVGEPLEFEARLLQLSREFPPDWDLVSLVPAAGVCERSRWLPWHPSSDIIHPRVSFSRTTAIVYSERGVTTLLANMPADNTVDMWYRRLMRQGKLNVYTYCGGLVKLSADAAIPVAH